MVEYTAGTNTIFEALADETRRDILLRVYEQQMNVSQIATEYDMSMAAVSKHVHILESAGLVYKIKSGKERIVSFNDCSLDSIAEFISLFTTINN